VEIKVGVEFLVFRVILEMQVGILPKNHLLI